MRRVNSNTPGGSSAGQGPLVVGVVGKVPGTLVLHIFTFCQSDRGLRAGSRKFPRAQVRATLALHPDTLTDPGRYVRARLPADHIQANSKRSP